MNELKELFEILFASGTDNVIAGIAFKLTGIVLVVYYIIGFIKSNQPQFVGGGSSEGSSRTTASKPKARRATGQPSFSNTTSIYKGTDVDKKVTQALASGGFNDVKDGDETTSTGYKAQYVFERLSSIMSHANEIQDAIIRNEYKDVVVSGIDVKISGDMAYINMGSAPKIIVPANQVRRLSTPTGFRGYIDDGSILSTNAFHIR